MKSSKEFEFKKDYKTRKLSQEGGNNYNEGVKSEKVIEDEEWVNKNDKGVSTKTGEAFKYIPKEEIAEDDGDIEEKIADKIDNTEVEEEDNELEDIDEEKIKKLKKEIEDKPINFFQDNTDVAHVGPDFKNSSDNKEEEELDKQKEFGVDNDEHMSFLNKIRHSLDGLFRKDYRREYRHWKSSKDNLKTLSDSKKERMIRGKLREITRDGKNYEDGGEYEGFNRIIGDSYEGEYEDRIIPGLATLQKKEEMKMDEPIDESLSIGELEKIVGKTKEEKDVA